MVASEDCEAFPEILVKKREYEEVRLAAAKIKLARREEHQHLKMSTEDGEIGKETW